MAAATPAKTDASTSGAVPNGESTVTARMASARRRSFADHHHAPMTGKRRSHGSRIPGRAEMKHAALPRAPLQEIPLGEQDVVGAAALEELKAEHPAIVTGTLDVTDYGQWEAALADFATRGWLRLEGKSVVILDRERLARRAR